jgi:hypothetical protein
LSKTGKSFSNIWKSGFTGKGNPDKFEIADFKNHQGTFFPSRCEKDCLIYYIIIFVEIHREEKQ